jgi:MFS family permease
VVGLGNIGIAAVPITKLLSTWFDRRRGFAIGIASTGVGLGGFAIAQPLGAYLIPTFGWRLSFLSLGILTWSLIIPAALFIVRSRPEDMGLTPDDTPDNRAGSGPATTAPSRNDWTLRAALVTLPFWFILAAFVFSTYSHTSIILHQINFLTDIGLDVAAASSALGFVALGSALGKFIFGWLCDRIQAKYVATISVLLIATGVVILLNIHPSSPPFLIWLYVIPLGLGVGGWLPTLSVITSRTFGLAYYGAIFGILTMGMNLGVAFGPTIAGYMYDSMQTYVGVFILLLVLLVIAITSMLSVRQPKHRGAHNRGKSKEAGHLFQISSLRVIWTTYSVFAFPCLLLSGSSLGFGFLNAGSSGFAYGVDDATDIQVPHKGCREEDDRDCQYQGQYHCSFHLGNLLSFSSTIRITSFPSYALPPNQLTAASLNA